jgi:hypothetical protein
MKNTTCRWGPFGSLKVRDRSVDENCPKYCWIPGMKLGISKLSMESSWTLVNVENSRSVEEWNISGENLPLLEPHFP